MPKSILRSTLVVASIFVSSAACSSELAGQWNLSVENLEHRAAATLKVEFTDEPAHSCLGGEWKIVKVDSAMTNDENFFPVSDPLAYQIEDNQLTIGRNELCDAYLLLKGPIEGFSIRGSYSSFGPGGNVPLGYFNLNQAR
jgi:hypothetical protein